MRSATSGTFSSSGRSGSLSAFASGRALPPAGRWGIASAATPPAKIGTIVQKIALARWSRTLSSLTSAGVPMLEAIDVTGRTAGNTVVENAMTAVHNSMQGGGTIASALAGASIFPSLVTNMVRVGEETGALDTTLGKVADFYEEQVEVAVKALTSILEPIMIAVVGSVVGFMILAMYLPMFHVYDAIK